MRKNINVKSKKNNKEIIIVLVCFIFIFFLCSCLVLFNRNYILPEKMLKSISCKLNSFIINNVYTKNNLNKNLISSKITYLEKENNELRNLLNLNEEKTEYVFSEVINHNSRLWLNTIEITSGVKNKIKKGMPVINENGLVGFINKISKDTSEVKLITNLNENDMVSVLIENGENYLSGILKEYDTKKRLFKITDCLSKEKIEKGSKVVLSGYDNELYKGIYIGIVKKEETSNHGLSKTLWVSSEVDFNNILFVAIIKDKK